MRQEIARFTRYLRASRKSPATIEAYELAARQLADFLEGRGEVLELGEIGRREVQDFLIDVLERAKPATALARYRCLQQFFRFLVDEELIERSPMERVKPPKAPEYRPRVLREDELKRLLAACEGVSFEDRRDLALLRVFMDTGARRAEVAGLRWLPADPLANDVDLDRGLLRLVETKGGRERLAPMGQRTGRALDRYLRLRERHPLAHLPNLWLSARGPLSGSGMLQVVGARGRQAGVEGLHPHVFRHTAAHFWLANGGQEGDLMQIAGWKSPQMLRRYASSTAAERAISAHRTRSLSDRL